MRAWKWKYVLAILMDKIIIYCKPDKCLSTKEPWMTLESKKLKWSNKVRSCWVLKTINSSYGNWFLWTKILSISKHSKLYKQLIYKYDKIEKWNIEGVKVTTTRPYEHINDNSCKHRGTDHDYLFGLWSFQFCKMIN